MGRARLWRRADVALAWLVVLATLAAGITLALSERGLEALLALAVTACQRSLDETLAHGADVGRVLLLLPLTLGLTLAVAQALRLTLVTRRLVAGLQLARCAPPKRLRRLGRKAGLPEPPILVCAEQPLVFTQGLLKPRTWLATGVLRTLNDAELEAVLRHEAHHVNARDPLKIFAARCLARALFFVPVARDLCQAYSTAKEIAADEYAARAMGDRLPLAGALRKLIAAQPAPLPESALVSQLGVTEARLLALLDPGRPLPLFPLPRLPRWRRASGMALARRDAARLPRWRRASGMALARRDAARLGLSAVWLLLFLLVAVAPAAGHLPSVAECTVSTALTIRSMWGL